MVSFRASAMRMVLEIIFFRTLVKWCGGGFAHQFTSTVYPIGDGLLRSISARFREELMTFAAHTMIGDFKGSSLFANDRI
ncbi:MAG: hypothetical protein ABSA81_08315 [Candidatus Bathyarchaeia archaeon]